MADHTPATPAALYKMISIPEAQTVVLRETPQLDSQDVSLHEAAGKVLLSDVKARDDLPPFPASIKVAHLLQLYFLPYQLGKSSKLL